MKTQQDVRHWFIKRGWTPLVRVGSSEHFTRGGERIVLAAASEYPQKEAAQRCSMITREVR